MDRGSRYYAAAARGRSAQNACMQGLRRLLEQPNSSKWAKGVLVFICANIVISITALILESSNAIREAYSGVFKGVEAVTTVIFTIEYILRWFIAGGLGESRLKWCIQPLNVCDLLAVIPWYISLCAEDGVITALRVLRIIRIAKFFRLWYTPESSSGVLMLFRVIVDSIPALRILVFCVGIGLFLFGTAFYYSERLGCPDFDSVEAFTAYADECISARSRGSKRTPSGESCCYFRCSARVLVASSAAAAYCQAKMDPDEDIPVTALASEEYPSIPSATWLAIVTMTTVGYGDITPSTFLGRFCAMLCMLSGVLLIAVPVAIVGSKFHTAYEKNTPVTSTPVTRTASMTSLDSMTNVRSSTTLAVPVRSISMTTALGLARLSRSFSQRRQSSSTPINQAAAVDLRERISSLQRDIGNSIELKQEIRCLSQKRSRIQEDLLHNLCEMVEALTSNFERKVPLCQKGLWLFDHKHPIGVGD